MGSAEPRDYRVLPALRTTSGGGRSAMMMILSITYIRGFCQKKPTFQLAFSIIRLGINN